jgi:hypothetical protein
MPYRELTSFPDAARGNPALAMTRERLKDKLRAHGVNGWHDELPDPVSRSESTDPLATWESEGGSRASPSMRPT